MSAIMKVLLTDHAAEAQWGDKAFLSFNQGGAAIHLSGDEAECLRIIQRAGRRLDSQGIKQAALVGSDWDLERRYAFYQGFYNPRAGQSLYLGDVPAAEQGRLDALLEVTRWIRQITNATPEELYPQTLAEQAASFIGQQAPEHVSFDIISGETLKELGHIGTYQVGRGSERVPALLMLDYNPGGDPQTPVAACLVGKGITFDSGGYSLKSSEGMLTMKHDMGGAALLVGALGFAIRQGLNSRVKLYLCCAENLVNDNAFKLGDILRYKNGLSVEVVNTDAEGRLVLADGLLAAGETGAPLIIDAATLTGAAFMALGGHYHATFALDQALQARFLAYAETQHEPFWPLPLAPWHRQQCPSYYAETANSRPIKGGGPGGASNAAGFLSRFVPREGQGWLHLDLAAAFSDNGSPLWAPGATALGLATIAECLLQETAEP